MELLTAEGLLLCFCIEAELLGQFSSCLGLPVSRTPLFLAVVGCHLEVEGAPGMLPLPDSERGHLWCHRKSINPQTASLHLTCLS